MCWIVPTAEGEKSLVPNVQGHRLAPLDFIERSEATKRFASPVHPVVR
jgi:hypothetical protein